MATFHPTIQPPYYVCVFSSQHSSSNKNLEGYAELAHHIDQLAMKQQGYLGIDSARNESGFGITVSYWKSDEDMKEWKKQANHLGAQRLGHERFYADFHIHIAKVEREYGMSSNGNDATNGDTRWTEGNSSGQLQEHKKRVSMLVVLETWII